MRTIQNISNVCPPLYLSLFMIIKLQFKILHFSFQITPRPLYYHLYVDVGIAPDEWNAKS